MSSAVSILTVCLGNICRSPTAEAALREAAADRGVDIDVDSAGTGAWHVGNPPDARMRAAGAQAGLTIAGVAQRVEVAHLRAADLVLAMDRANLGDLERIAASAGVDTPIVLFRDFDPQATGAAEVPDPYYGGPDGFAEVVEMCRRSAQRLIGSLAEGGVDGALAARREDA